MLFEEFLSDSNWTASSIKLFKLNHTATIYDVWWICMIVVANWQASPWKLVRFSFYASYASDQRILLWGWRSPVNVIF